MKYTLEIEIDEDKFSFAEEFFKSISFVKKVRHISSNEITYPAILKSIESYEKNEVKPTSRSGLPIGFTIELSNI